MTKGPEPQSAQWRQLIDDRLTRTRLLALAGAGVTAIAAGFVLPTPNLAEEALRHTGYYWMLAGFGLFLASIWRAGREIGVDWATLRRATNVDWPVIAILGAVLWIALVSEPWGFKVTNDEYVLQATALNLHLEREPAALVRAYDVNGVFVPLFAYTDKRPFFFAFVLSLMADLTGYRPANAFVLNAVLAAASLVITFALVRRLTGNRAAALTGAVLWGSLPIFAQNANGSGMELLNVTLIGLVVLLAWNYLVHPTEARATVLVLATVLLAQTRYESALFVAVTAGVVVIGWRTARRIILSWPMIISPLLLLPYAWQNRLTSANKALWELQAGEETRFGGAYLVNNLQHAARYLFAWQNRLIGNSWLLSAAGVVATAFAAIWLVRRWRTPTAGWVVVAYAIGVAVNLAVLMFYYWGQLDDPVVQRLSLPSMFIAAVAAGWLVGKIAERGFDARWAVGIAAVYLIAVSRPVMANHYYTDFNTAPAQLRWEKSVLQRQPPGPRLLISNKTVLPWIMDRQPAIIIDGARERREQLKFHLEAGTFTEILVTQRLQPTSPSGGFQVDPRDTLPPDYHLELVAEKRFGATLARISRLVSIGDAMAVRH